MPRYTDLVASLPSTVPFVGPETQERARGEAFIARIGANENVFGPSPKVIDVMASCAHEIWRYADPENFDLKNALAKHHEIPDQNIMVGEGIDSLLGLLVRMLVAPGDPVVTSAGAYPTFNFHVTGFGGELITVPFKDDHEDIDALVAAAVKVQAKIVYLANPDNPMGTSHSAERVQNMMSKIPEGTVLCLDEAYGEFAPDGTLPAIDVSDKRVIRMRTFSKAYGMAGARIGYAMGHRDIINSFNKIRNHFGMNRSGQIAALAALQDQDWLQTTIEKVRAANQRITKIALANGLKPLPSVTNFVTIDCGHGADFAKALVAALGELGIFVRMPFVAPQNRCIRISAGTDAQLDAFEAALPKALALLSRQT
ncbi:MAG: histidinol-phosphate aminotransferase [Hyphomicrobiales bacterium]|nr:MAG: histidinol-phosphate aminotransferase [Hyphomicrobiales bacterium]